MSIKGKPSKLVSTLIYLVVFSSGLGIGYIWATHRTIQVVGIVNCHFPIIGT